MSALDERLTLLEERIFGPAEKDAEYPKVWNCCWGSFVGWGKGRPEGYRSTSWEWPGLPNAGMPVSNARNAEVAERIFRPEYRTQPNAESPEIAIFLKLWAYMFSFHVILHVCKCRSAKYTV